MSATYQRNPDGTEELWTWDEPWSCVLKVDADGKVIYVNPDMLHPEANVQVKPEAVR